LSGERLAVQQHGIFSAVRDRENGVSGKTLREFRRRNIFRALEMTHTNYRDDHSSRDRRTAHRRYSAKENGIGYRLNVSYFEQTGDGAVHTSVEDLLKWDENFYSGQVGGKDSFPRFKNRAIEQRQGTGLRKGIVQLRTTAGCIP